MVVIGNSANAWWPQQSSEVRVTRAQLYELAWSSPMRQLAGEFGLSDNGLSKALRQHGIPLPPVGYWAKLQAGKPVRRTPLPVRGPGQERLLTVHGALAERFETEAAPAESPDGPFASDLVPEDLDALRPGTLEQIGRVAVPRTLDRPHRALHALLRRDQRRRDKIATASYPRWELAPVFDAPDEMRKLRIVNALMHALARLAYECRLGGAQEPSFIAKIGNQHVRVKIAFMGETGSAHRRHGDALPASSNKPLRIELSDNLPDGFPRSWEDAEAKLESRIAEIAAAIVAAGEARYRLGIKERLDHQARMEEWRAERRRAALVERNKERLAALHRSADLLRTAQGLRALIGSITAAVEAGRRDLDPSALAEWKQWAAAEADRIDPVLSGQVDEHLIARLPDDQNRR